MQTDIKKEMVKVNDMSLHANNCGLDAALCNQRNELNPYRFMYGNADTKHQPTIQNIIQLSMLTLHLVAFCLCNIQYKTSHAHNDMHIEAETQNLITFYFHE